MQQGSLLCGGGPFFVFDAGFLRPTTLRSGRVGRRSKGIDFAGFFPHNRGLAWAFTGFGENQSLQLKTPCFTSVRMAGS